MNGEDTFVQSTEVRETVEYTVWEPDSLAG
jgi:hypothetical protein